MPYARPSPAPSPTPSRGARWPPQPTQQIGSRSTPRATWWLRWKRAKRCAGTSTPPPPARCPRRRSIGAR
eukprot:2028476-Lingulodinium_polyedra.AAC.1